MLYPWRIQHTVTTLLREVAEGDKGALDRLVPLVYAELRRIARLQLRGERPGHTLEPTALVHEAYARLAGSEQPGFKDRAHFLAVAARSMRQILIDYARVRNARKRDHGQPKISIDEAGDVSLERPRFFILLDDALQALEKQDPLMARLIELRYFGGLTAEESAAAVDLEIGEVRRKIALAQAWLRRQLGADQPASRHL